MNRLGLKIACLVASILIWMRVAATTEMQAELPLPVRVVNLGPGLTDAGSEIPEFLIVGLRGSKLRFIGHNYLNRPAGVIDIDLSGYGPAPPFEYDVGEADVRTNLEITAVPVLTSLAIGIHIDSLVTRQIPVAVPTSGNLSAKLQLLAPPSAVPALVTVTGPGRLVDGMGAVSVPPVLLDRLTDSSTRKAQLVVPTPQVTVQPQEVTVQIELTKIEERTLANVPVVLLRDIDHDDVGVSPPVADLVVSGPADSVATLTQAQLSITIPLTGLADGVHQLSCEVAHPDWLKLTAVEPAEFTVFIGKAPTDTTLQERP